MDLQWKNSSFLRQSYLFLLCFFFNVFIFSINEEEKNTQINFKILCQKRGGQIQKKNKRNALKKCDWEYNKWSRKFWLVVHFDWAHMQMWPIHNEWEKKKKHSWLWHDMISSSLYFYHSIISQPHPNSNGSMTNLSIFLNIAEDYISYLLPLSNQVAQSN